MWAVEYDEQREPLVRRETVVGTRGDEDGSPLLERDGSTFDLEHAVAFQDDVDLVELVRCCCRAPALSST